MTNVNIRLAVNGSDDKIVCYAPSMITTTGIWQGDNPLDYSLPLFILQLTLAVILTRVLVFFLKPLNQPRVISEILGGIILGPSVLGQNEVFAGTVFPLRSVMVLETMANVGLLYYLFLVGVEMDTSVLKRTGKKALAVAMAGMVLPFIISGCFTLLHQPHYMNQGIFILFLGIALSVTAFPVLARILAELKLVNTELGRIAMSAALVNDLCAWGLLAVAVALADTDSNSWSSLWVILSSVVFILVCVYVVRPAILWIIHKTPEGETFSEFYLCLILSGVMVSGFITDAIGTHSVFGAFVFGLVIPNGPLGVTLIEKLEDFVAGLLIPLFFAVSGLKTNLANIHGSVTWGIIFLVVCLACAGKIISTMIVSMCCHMPLLEGFTLGLLMNTKGLVEMIILNVGRDQEVLGEDEFSIMVVATLIMTAMVTPIATRIYKPTRAYTPYKIRTIETLGTDEEFRTLVCIHTPRNVPTIINLLEASNTSKTVPLCVYVLHLVELTGRASAMLIVHNTRKSGRPALNRTQAQSDHIISSFQTYEQQSDGVTIQHLTAISPYSTMREDICNLAEDKRVAFIILPFHKQLTVDGGMEATNPAFRTVNQNVLDNAPCSVGILVDRGLNGSARPAESQVSHHIAVLFIGGPDDREALAYAVRMSERPGTILTVTRFIPDENTTQTAVMPPKAAAIDPRILKIEKENSREKLIDEAYMNQFSKDIANNGSIIYNEIVVNNGEETVAAIRSMDSVCDLYIVGRGQGMVSPLTAGLTDWSECPELGAIGDLLASSDFTATTSVLVVQQYAGLGSYYSERIVIPDSPGEHAENDQYKNSQMDCHWLPSSEPKGQPVFEP